MTDKVGIKIDPKQAISIHISDTLPDLQRGLTGDKNPDNRPEVIHKINLSIAIGVLEEKERLPCHE